MEKVTGLILVVLALIVGLKIVSDEVKGRVRLFSVRNVFLGGFIVFQLSSGAYSMFMDPTRMGYSWSAFTIGEESIAPVIYTIYCAVFLGTFFLGYRLVGPHLSIVPKLERAVGEPKPMGVLVLAVVLLLTSFLLRFTPVPYIGILATMFSVGLAATSVALVGYLWGRRPYDPLLLIMALGMFLLAWVIIGAAYGRRDVLSVTIAFIWGIFYGGLYRVSLWKYAVPLAILLVPAFALTSMISSVRGEARETGAVRKIQLVLSQGDPLHSLDEVFHGQGAGHISLWMVENFPGNFDYDYLFCLRYVFLNPIPRDFWPEKPLPYGYTLVDKANVRNVQTGTAGLRGRSGFNVGPGLIGSAHADGGFLIVPLYGVLFGLLLRIPDEVVRRNQSRVLLVIPAVAGIGQVLGISRGSVPLFTFHAIFLTITSYSAIAVLSVLAKFPLPAPRQDGQQKPDDETNEPAQLPSGDNNWAAGPSTTAGMVTGDGRADPAEPDWASLG